MIAFQDTMQDRLLHRLRRFAVLDDRAVAAVRTLPMELREVSASSYLIREGQRPIQSALVIDGYVYSQKLTIEGARAILSLRLPGDLLDLPNLYLDESDYDMVALTPLTLAGIAIADLRALAARHATLNEALWRMCLIEVSIGREWLLNVGRRSARVRTAHLLCEIAARFEAAGIGRDQSYTLPMTQEQLGDCLGLTSVHINRVLKQLQADGLIRRRKRQVLVADAAGLYDAGDFNERYLHAGMKPGDDAMAVG